MVRARERMRRRSQWTGHLIPIKSDRLISFTARQTAFYRDKPALAFGILSARHEPYTSLISIQFDYISAHALIISMLLSCCEHTHTVWN